jgi:hypothetical protein
MAKDGDALHQCICGHERHEGQCGKPRYSSTDPCTCNTYIEAGGDPLPQLRKIAEAAKLFCIVTKGEMDELEGTQSAAAPAEFMLLHEAVEGFFGSEYWMDGD